MTHSLVYIAYDSQLGVDGGPTLDVVLRLEERPAQRDEPPPLVLRHLRIDDVAPALTHVARREQRDVIEVVEHTK